MGSAEPAVARDEDLVVRVAGGDEVPFRELFSRYASVAHALALAGPSCARGGGDRAGSISSPCGGDPRSVVQRVASASRSTIGKMPPWPKIATSAA